MSHKIGDLVVLSPSSMLLGWITDIKKIQRVNKKFLRMFHVEWLPTEKQSLEYFKGLRQPATSFSEENIEAMKLYLRDFLKQNKA